MHGISRRSYSKTDLLRLISDGFSRKCFIVVISTKFKACKNKLGLVVRLVHVRMNLCSRVES